MNDSKILVGAERFTALDVPVSPIRPLLKALAISPKTEPIWPKATPSRSETSFRPEMSSLGVFGSSYGLTAAVELQIKMGFYRRFGFTTRSQQKTDAFLEPADADSVVLGTFFARFNRAMREMPMAI